MNDKNGIEIKVGDIVQLTHTQASEIIIQGEVIGFTHNQVRIMVLGSTIAREARRMPQNIEVIKNET